MLKKIFVFLCVAVLIAAIFAGCSNKNEPEQITELASDSENAASEDIADTTEDSEKDVIDKKALMLGSWENDTVVYTFKEDGTGSVTDKETDTGTPFDYTVDTDRCVITRSLGSPDNTEEIDFNFQSVFTLSLRFSDGEVVTLYRVARENPLAGTWVNDEVSYFFFADGTGITEDVETDQGVAFNYALSDDDDSFTIYFDGPESGEKTAFALSEDGTLVLTFADGKTVTLTREAE